MTRACDKILRFFYGDGNGPRDPRCPLIGLVVSIVIVVAGFALSMSSIKGATTPEFHIIGAVISGVGSLLCLIFSAIVLINEFKHFNSNPIPSFVTEAAEVSPKQYEVFTSEKNYERRKISPVQLLSTKKVLEQTDSTSEGSEYGCISSGSQPLLPPFGSQTLAPSSSEPRSILKTPKDPQYLPKNDLKVKLRIDPIWIPSFEVIKETPEEIREICVPRSPVPSPCKVWKTINLNHI